MAQNRGSESIRAHQTKRDTTSWCLFLFGVVLGREPASFAHSQRISARVLTRKISAEFAVRRTPRVHSRPPKNAAARLCCCVFLLAAHYSNLRRFPFSLCETAVVQTAEGNSTEFAVRRTPRVTFAPTVYDHIQAVLSPLFLRVFLPPPRLASRPKPALY